MAIRPLILGVLLATALPAAAAEEGSSIPWTDRLDEAARRAEAEGRPQFVDVWAVWCVPCRKMEETTFRDPTVLAGMDAVVPLKVDADAQPMFLERHRVDAYPTYLVLDARGGEIARRTGYVGAADMAALLRGVREGYPAWLEHLRSPGDAGATRAAAAFLRAVGSPERAIEVLKPLAGRDESVDLEIARAQREAGREKAASKILQKLAGGAKDPAVREEASALLAP